MSSGLTSEFWDRLNNSHFPWYVVGPDRSREISDQDRRRLMEARPGRVAPVEPSPMFDWRMTLKRNPVPLLGMRCFIDTRRGWLLASWGVGFWGVVGSRVPEFIPASEVSEWWGPICLPEAPAFTARRGAVHDATDLEVSG